MPSSLSSVTDSWTVQADELDEDMVDKRSIPMAQLQRRQTSAPYDFLAIGESPWYCYWNQTIEEFWIFLERDNEGNPISVAQGSSMVTSAPPDPFTFGSGSPTTPSDATAQATSTKSIDVANSSPTWDEPKEKRNQDFPFPATSLGPGMPNLVKMVEKRKPHSNVQPYCQQMTVKPNWQIVPKEDVPTICIEENQYSAEPTSIDKRGKERFARRNDEYMAQLESLCICEWMST